jgi:hypothetical protein
MLLDETSCKYGGQANKSKRTHPDQRAGRGHAKRGQAGNRRCNCAAASDESPKLLGLVGIASEGGERTTCRRKTNRSADGERKHFPSST